MKKKVYSIKPLKAKHFSPVLFRSGSDPVQVNLFSCPYFNLVLRFFKKVVHMLESGETPSYSAFHQVPNYELHS